MPRGPMVAKLCGICGESCGKYVDKNAEHVRDAHGGSAVTKAKALELYPDAPSTVSLSELMPNETVWIVKADGHAKLWAERDLFKTGPWHPSPSAGPVPASFQEDPAPQPAKKMGLLALHGKLVELRKLLDELLEET